jgi:hypothetical protein
MQYHWTDQKQQKLSTASREVRLNNPTRKPPVRSSEGASKQGSRRGEGRRHQSTDEQYQASAVRREVSGTDNRAQALYIMYIYLPMHPLLQNDSDYDAWSQPQ